MPRATVPSRPGLGACAAALLLASACGERRPAFDVETASDEIAEAFDVEPSAVAVYSDLQDEDDPLYWLVDFRLEGVRPFLQARFSGHDGARWALSEVRQRPGRGEEAPWQEVGVMLGSLRREAAEKAQETERLMEQLGLQVEAHAVDHGGEYPVVSLDGLRALLVNGGYVREWDYDTDAWGSPLLYHAAPAGDAYILVSPGADAQLDRPADEYQARTNRYDMVYGGRTSDPEADIIFVTGTFAQTFAPEG